MYVHELVAISISPAELSLFTDNNHSRAQAVVVDVVRVWQECVYAAALKVRDLLLVGDQPLISTHLHRTLRVFIVTCNLRVVELGSDHYVL